jgi:solute carrier family 25 (adenine nucleotide translocator) protein 4/5/6/31
MILKVRENGLHRGFVISCVISIIYRGCYFGFYDTLKPILLDPDAGIALSFLLGYGVTVTSGLMSYPVDTIRRRMMMTSGQAVKYKGSLDCMFQIIRYEGVISLFKGAGANVIGGIAGGGMLAGFDKLVQLYTGIKVDTSDGD